MFHGDIGRLGENHQEGRGFEGLVIPEGSRGGSDDGTQ